jgi:hypothetical protein
MDCRHGSRLYQTRSLVPSGSGGCQVRSKAQGSGPCPVGVRGFKSHPPHHKRPALLPGQTQNIPSLIPSETQKASIEYRFDDRIRNPSYHRDKPCGLRTPTRQRPSTTDFSPAHPPSPPRLPSASNAKATTYLEPKHVDTAAQPSPRLSIIIKFGWGRKSQSCKTET